ncbi:AAA family ATPase [Pseudoalteromonas espejiana]
MNLKVLKPALLEEFHHKCAFCESIVTEDTSAIEHFRPKGGARRQNGQVDKAFYVWLTLDWDNLYAACRVCSVTKANNFPVGRTGKLLMPLDELRRFENAHIIDPCFLAPSSFIRLEKNGTVKSETFIGNQTIKILGLNRLDLIERRKTAILELLSEVDGYINNNYSNVYHSREHIKNKISDGAEFSGLLTDFLRRDDILSQNQLNVASSIIKPQHIPQEVIDRTQVILNFSDPNNLNLFNYINSNHFYSISHVDISGFKGIKHFSTNIILQEGKGSCYAFLGINGLGKTTILQAMTLGLLGVKRLNQLDFKYFKRFGLNSNNLVHKDFSEAKIRISFNNGEYSNELVIARIQSKNVSADIRRFELYGNTEFEPCVLSYGAFRLPAKSHLKDSLSNATGFRVQSMFNETARINGIQGIFSKHKIKNSLIAIADILESILGSEGIRFEVSNNGKLSVQRSIADDKYETIGFNVLSSGYQTIVSVVCDILDVLLSVEQDGISSLESTQAFVMIDELDAHLHPSWRLKILQAFRDAFPLIHFYVSTHDPLIMRSLNEGELLILREDQEDGLVAITDYPSLKGASIDQLLTSDMFGLQTTQDIETEDILQDYYKELERVANESSDSNSIEIIENISPPKNRS